MPIYVYECQSCHKTDEVLQKFGDPPKKKCPHCGGKLQKKITSSTFQLKGGGWYKDGYASKKPETKKESDSKEPAKKDEGEKKEAPKKTEPKKEEKPSSGSK